MAKVIVIDGPDGSGKGTQCSMLKQRLISENYTLFSCSFPRYKDESSICVRRYLDGLYGEKPSDVSAYQASLCYALDRMDFFKSNLEFKEIKENPNVIILTDRYTTSNLIHQGAKIDNPAERAKFNEWLWDLEYNILEIPRPDMVIIPLWEVQTNIDLVYNRGIENRAGDNNMSKDIHEEDIDYLRRCIMATHSFKEHMSFDFIDCMTPDGEKRTKEDIHEEIYGRVKRKVLSKIEGR